MALLKVCLLFFIVSSSLFMLGQGQTPDELYESAMILHEEFQQEFEDPSINNMDTTRRATRADETKHAHSSNLRRQVQQASSSSLTTTTPATCYPLSPRNVYACTEGDEFCQDRSNFTCAEEFGNYDCRCSGGGGLSSNNETSCPYCQIETANAIVCQVAGSTTTFVDPSFSIMTCSCDYLGNGFLVQICFPPTDRPTNHPTQTSTSKITTDAILRNTS